MTPEAAACEALLKRVRLWNGCLTEFGEIRDAFCALAMRISIGEMETAQAGGVSSEAKYVVLNRTVYRLEEFGAGAKTHQDRAQLVHVLDTELQTLLPLL